MCEFAGAWNLQFYASHTWLWFDSVAESFDIRSKLTQPFRTIRGKDSGLGFGDLRSSRHSLLLFPSCRELLFAFHTQCALVLLHVSSYGLCRELCSPSHIACSCSLHFSSCWLCRELYSPSHTAWSCLLRVSICGLCSCSPCRISPHPGLCWPYVMHKVFLPVQVYRSKGNWHRCWNCSLDFYGQREDLKVLCEFTLGRHQVDEQVHLNKQHVSRHSSAPYPAARNIQNWTSFLVNFTFNWHGEPGSW